MITIFKCSICEQEFANPNDCLEHEKIHVKKIPCTFLKQSGKPEECVCAITEDDSRFLLKFIINQLPDEDGKKTHRSYSFSISKNKVLIEAIDTKASVSERDNVIANS